jgi:hypothetical protein
MTENQMPKTLINFSQNIFDDIFEENTDILSKREAEENKWLNVDGSPKKNYPWKYASKTKQGDAGESVIRTTLEYVLSEVYGSDVEVTIVNKGKGDFDVKVYIPIIDKTVKIEAKTATEDVNGCHQFNGLKKNIDYDFAFLFGVAPEDFYFSIESHEYLCETMTTNMSRDVEGSYKYTLSQKRLTEYNPHNLYEALVDKGIIE